jgi:hypothetical protein
VVEVFFWSDGMEKRRGKWIDYFDLIDSFKIPGCPLCNRIKGLSWKFLDNLFYERVTDVWTRVKLRKAKGFCNWHAWMSTEIPNSNSGIAMIYKDLLDAEITPLSKWAKARDTLHKRRRLKLPKKDQSVFLPSWTNKALCPICESIREHERIETGTLLDFIDEETFSQEFEKSSGICIKHLIYIMQNFGEHPNLLFLVEKQIKKYQSLSEELGEFIRKLDYRFSKELKGSEADSWKRVLEQFSGKKEVFGNEMDGGR